ncbi:DUF1963 domain-containing protein [Actinoplanes aureus]|uniref:DUF1963 domain-containing protein n=1 Tax=Actinoplanes aureus TaxID=2792083 RepID=A0A931CG51_9ACTN|nr:DUF1963 domain-containing protein [Actinoplanes aureus]MBG0569300.1 DUF1963 domain-containing protein [Actinoplanes aureus]
MAHEPADHVSGLVDGWRTLSRWEQQGHPGVRQWNRLVDQLNRLAEVAVHDPEQVRALQRVAEQDQDRSVRLRARQVARPFVPRPDSATDLKRWLNNPLVGLGDLELHPEPALTVVPDAFVDGLTWFCGEPAAGLAEWPRRADGIPLAHLLQVELGDHPPLSKRHPAMPTEGVLQFFHDLETIGDEPVDGQNGGWLVHHSIFPETAMLRRPNDLTDDAFHDRCTARVEQTWTFPSPLDLDLDDQTFDLLQAANERVLETVTSSWGIDELEEPPDAVPLLFGHSAEERLIANQRLADVLPLSDRDDYLLLADIPGVGPLDGWIGDMGHIEFWIRDSDLAKQDFARTWALLR